MSKFRLALWRAFEYMFARISGVHPVSQAEEMLFLVAKRTYFSQPFTVQGISVHRGDKVIELHINNELVMKVLQEESSLVAATVKLLIIAKHSLPALAAYLSADTFVDRQVLYGITFIHRGISRLGFETLPMPDGWFRRFTTWHLKRLYRIVNPNATAAMAHRQTDFVPKIVAISKQELFRRYLHTETTDPLSQKPVDIRDVQPDA